MKSHSGFTLIELVVVMSAAAVLSAIAIGLVHQVMRLHQSETASQQSQATLNRLVRQFRQDVHRSERAEATRGDAGATLTLTASESTVYAIADGQILRTSHVHGGQPRREAFNLPGAGFELNVAGNRIELTIVRAGRPGDAANVVGAVVASTNRLARGNTD